MLEEYTRFMEDEVAAALDRAHTEIASNLDYNNEFAMGCAVILAYWSARKDYYKNNNNRNSFE